MTITHIFKDGSTSASLEGVKVPREIVEDVVNIVRTKTTNKKKGEKKDGK